MKPRQQYEHNNVVREAFRVVGKVWNLPNTAIGLVWGGLGLLFGAKVSIGNNAIQFENHPFQLFGDLTLGNTIFYRGDLGPTDEIAPGYLPGHTYGDHELQHTYQGQILGPLYLPLYGLGLIHAMFNPVYGGGPFGASHFMERGPYTPQITQQGLPPFPWPYAK